MAEIKITGKLPWGLLVGFFETVVKAGSDGTIEQGFVEEVYSGLKHIMESGVGRQYAQNSVPAELKRVKNSKKENKEENTMKTKTEEQISRCPLPGESNADGEAYYRTRCDMQPDADDLVIATEQYLDRRWGFRTVEKDRANRAGVAPRLEVIGKYDLASWKEAVKALFAITKGFASKGLFNLIEGCYYLTSKNEVAAAVGGFKAGSNKLNYVERVSLEVLEAIIGVEYRDLERSLRQVAILSGLEASQTQYKFTGASYPGYYVDVPYDLSGLLAGGEATFGQEAYLSLLQNWEGLANRGEAVPVPTEDEIDPVAKEYGITVLDEIPSWVKKVNDAAWEEESSNCPNSSFSNNTDDDGNGTMEFRWDGTWTKNRFTLITITFEKGKVTELKLQWQSGTGEPSTFLGVEEFLGLDACKSFQILAFEESN